MRGDEIKARCGNEYIACDEEKGEKSCDCDCYSRVIENTKQDEPV